jgi:hypothetical protein
VMDLMRIGWVAFFCISESVYTNSFNAFVRASLTTVDPLSNAIFCDRWPQT